MYMTFVSTIHIIKLIRHPSFPPVSNNNMTTTRVDIIWMPRRLHEIVCQLIQDYTCCKESELAKYKADARCVHSTICGEYSINTRLIISLVDSIDKSEKRSPWSLSYSCKVRDMTSRPLDQSRLCMATRLTAAVSLVW